MVGFQTAMTLGLSALSLIIIPGLILLAKSIAEISYEEDTRTNVEKQIDLVAEKTK